MTIAIRVGSKTYHVSNIPPQGGIVDPQAATLFRRLRLDELAVDGLRRLLAREKSHLVRRFAADIVREEVANRIQAGAWTIVISDTPQIRIEGTAVSAAAKTGSKNDPTKNTTKDWVEIELIDKNKRPVKGVKVEVTLPDGTKESGVLNDKGSFRKDGIDPGTCRVTFPDLDGREWAKSGNFVEGNAVELLKGPPKLAAGPYTVKQGDHISSIAIDAGFVSWKTIWDDGKNASIKAKRNPNVLYPGDVIEIPAKQKKEESAPTGEYHTFETVGDPVELRIVVLDWAGRPVVDADLQVELDSNEKLKTGGDGSAKKKVDPAGIKEGNLTVKTVKMAVKLGFLDPVEEFTGQRGRLDNLGYRASPSESTADLNFLSAVEEFQCDNGLTVDGICGPNTQSKLKEIHGS